MTARVLLFLALFCAAPALGCQAMIASPAEYAAFRQARVAPTVEGRLQASSKYLQEYPSGHWSKPVRGWLVRADKIYFRAKRGSAAGLQAYLRAVPAGAHRAEARRLLAARAAQRDAGEDLARAGGRTEERLAAAADARAKARALLDSWLRRFLAAEAWQQPLRDAPASLGGPWNDAAAPPSCGDAAGGRRCLKTVTAEFVLPGVVAQAQAQAQARAQQPQPQPRTLELELATTEDASGRLVEVVLRGPQLFARLEEAATARVHDAADPSAQMNAVLHGTELVDAAFAALVAPVSECRKPATAPVVRDLDCRGAHVTVSVGEPADTITIRR